MIGFIICWSGKVGLFWLFRLSSGFIPEKLKSLNYLTKNGRHKKKKIEKKFSLSPWRQKMFPERSTRDSGNQPKTFFPRPFVNLFEFEFFRFKFSQQCFLKLLQLFHRTQFFTSFYNKSKNPFYFSVRLTIISRAFPVFGATKLQKFILE